MSWARRLEPVCIDSIVYLSRTDPTDPYSNSPIGPVVLSVGEERSKGFPLGELTIVLLPRQTQFVTPLV